MISNSSSLGRLKKIVKNFKVDTHPKRTFKKSSLHNFEHYNHGDAKEVSYENWPRNRHKNNK